MDVFRRMSGEKFLEHAERFKVGEIWNMQPVKFDYQFRAAITLLSRHGKEVHRIKIHAHEQTNLGSLIGIKKIGMQRRDGTEDTITEIKEIYCILRKCR